MRILVTGATGFVASHLIPALVREGNEVFALGHDESRLPPYGTPLVRDLRESHFAEGLPEVDAVIHLAQANVPFPDGAADLFAVNTAATAALLEYARCIGASRFLYASSASVYGMGDRPWSEDDDLAARDFYSATKVSGERVVQAYDAAFRTAILRLVAPFGPGQKGRMIPRLIESVRQGQPVSLNEGGRPRMNPIFVDDVVATVSRLLEDDESRVLNVGGNDVVTIREIAEAAGRALGREPVFESNGKDSGDIVCDNQRLRRLLGGRELVSFDDGLRQMAAVVRNG